MLHADSPHQLLDIDHRSRLALRVITAAGVLLMSGHTGDPVVEDYIYSVAVVINRIDQGVHAGVKEG